MIDGKLCILVSGNDVSTVKAYSDFFTANHFSVINAFDGEEVLSAYYKSNTAIDLIMLDAIMPKLNGFDVLSQLRRQGQNLPVIMLTESDADFAKIAELNSGADECIKKTVSTGVLLTRVQTILRRTGKNTSDKLVFGDIVVDKTMHTVLDCGTVVELTKREFDLLCYLITNERITLSRDRLLANVWGYDYDGDVRTVDTYIKQLRAKLKSHRYIKTIYRVGYKMEE